MSTKTSQVPMGQKLAFGFGMLANQMFPAILGIFMVVLVQNLGFPGWMWSTIYFFPRIFDAFTDPIMGFISDNTKSKWGRRRQYVFIGSIVMGISFVLMWQLYIDNSIEYNFAYFMFWSFVFYLGLTLFSVPYVAMGYEMSDDFHERTNIMAIAQWIGQWAWVIAPWFWVIMYRNGDDGWFPSAESATRTLAIWVGIVLMFIAMIPAIFIKSKSTLNENYSPLNLRNIKGSFNEIILGFKEALKIKPFRKLCISTFLIFNAFNTVATFTFFIIVYHLFNGNPGDAGIWPTLFGCLGALSTTFLVIPIVRWFSNKYGKKTAFIWSQSVSILGYILLWFLLVPGKPYLFILALPFFSFGIGSLFTLMMSMTSDVIDIDELNTGKRREGIFGAIYWWMVKFGFAIAGGLSGLILLLVGFKEGIPTTEQEGAIYGLRIFFSGIPILGTLIAIYVMYDYDVTEEKARENTRLIKERKNQKLSSAYSPGMLQRMTNSQLLQSKSQLDFELETAEQIDKKFNQVFNSGMHGLCFSPYTEGHHEDILSEKQINRMLDIIVPHTQWIRTFSSIQGNEQIPKIAQQKNMKTIVGAWISNDRARNELEIEALIKMANSGFVHIAAVGNEVLHRDEISETELINYIQRVREAIPKSIPIGYVDAYYQFLNRPNIVAACDVLLCNLYPFWEGAHIDYSISYLNQMLQLTQDISQGKKIIVTETGWPSFGETVEEAQPSKINAMKYFILSQEWAKIKNIELFHFSSFDETWKVIQEGNIGTSWGLWDKKEQFKYK
jgi:glycoside/pentoside/hexuronide:cation symporter, GPH family